jgi:hypothetical protein
MNLLMITKTNIIFSITITLLNLYHNKVWSSQRLLESSDVFLTSIRHHHMFSVTLDGQSMYSFCDAFFSRNSEIVWEDWVSRMTRWKSSEPLRAMWHYACRFDGWSVDGSARYFSSTWSTVCGSSITFLQ